jgi:hypothetical protein
VCKFELISVCVADLLRPLRAVGKLDYDKKDAHYYNTKKKKTQKPEPIAANLSIAKQRATDQTACRNRTAARASRAATASRRVRRRVNAVA